MCGRFTRQYNWKQVREFLDLKFPPADQPPPDLRPSYNVAPTQPVPVCRLNARGERELASLVWGLRPQWLDRTTPGPINARCETARTNPMFRGAYESRRCLVPASGFYEWRKTGDATQPYYIRLLNDPLFCFAGLWESRREGGRTLETFTILTTDANERVAQIHDRMPVILRPADYEKWLKGEPVPGQVFEPFPAEEMDLYPVSPRVNSPRRDEQSLTNRAEPEGSLW